VSELVPGSQCRSGILDDAGTLLLNEGVVLTTELRDSLLKRGIEYVEINPDDLVAGNQEGGRAGKRRAPAHSEYDPLAWQLVDRRGQPYNDERAERFTRVFADAAAVVGRIGHQLESASFSELRKLLELPTLVVDTVLEDADQSAAAAMATPERVELPRRCVQMCLLAVAIGIELGLREADVTTLGSAAILHDLGLYLLPARFRQPTSILDPNESWEFRKHPKLAARVFTGVPDVSDAIRAIVAQVHERIDGSGYPFGLDERRIHPLARVVGAADAYLTLVNPGPGRPGIVPHDALHFLFFDAQRGTFDVPVIEALIRSLTLFPIGSRVELDDGSVAVVTRREGDEIDRPTVRVAEAGGESLVALHHTDRRIAGPALEARESQMRLPSELIKNLRWETFDPHPGITPGRQKH